MNDFLQSIIDRDPAAKSKLSLILTLSPPYKKNII